jgi:hypothetical protein
MDVEVRDFDYDNSRDVNCLDEWCLPQQVFIRKPQRLATKLVRA